MQAIILATEKSTKAYPLTLTKPGLLLKVANKTLLEHNLEQLDGMVDGVIIAVDYKKEMIMERFGNKFGNLQLTYNEQKKRLDKEQILRQIKNIIKDEFIVINGNDIYCKTDSMPCRYPWDLLDANAHFVNKIKNHIRGTVEKGVTIKGEITVGEGSEVLNGVYIEGNVVIGKNCKIGPNCYLRGPITIGNDCRIGQAVEIKNCIIGDNSNVPHLNYVGDSIIGDGVNLGAGTIIANLRHDNSNIKSIVDGKLVDTGRIKFGSAIGDNVHTGINTKIYPGRKLWPNTSTKPGEVVNKDIVSGPNC